MPRTHLRIVVWIISLEPNTLVLHDAAHEGGVLVALQRTSRKELTSLNLVWRAAVVPAATARVSALALALALALAYTSALRSYQRHHRRRCTTSPQDGAARPYCLGPRRLAKTSGT